MKKNPEVAYFGCIFQYDVPNLGAGNIQDRRLGQLKVRNATLGITFLYRGSYPTTFDILHAFGGVMLIKARLLLGPIGQPG